MMTSKIENTLKINKINAFDNGRFLNDDKAMKI